MLPFIPLTIIHTLLLLLSFHNPHICLCTSSEQTDLIYPHAHRKSAKNWDSTEVWFWRSYKKVGSLSVPKDLHPQVLTAAQPIQRAGALWSITHLAPVLDGLVTILHQSNQVLEIWVSCKRLLNFSISQLQRLTSNFNQFQTKAMRFTWNNNRKRLRPSASVWHPCDPSCPHQWQATSPLVLLWWLLRQGTPEPLERIPASPTGREMTLLGQLHPEWVAWSKSKGEEWRSRFEFPLEKRWLEESLSEKLFEPLTLIFGILWKTGCWRGHRETRTGGGLLGQCCVGLFVFFRFGDTSSYSLVCVTLMAK